MVQHFLGTLQLPMAVYMLDYYLPMLSSNEGHNETELTMQSAGPIRQPWQPITFEFLLRAANLVTGKSKGGKMHLRSDIRALAKLKSSAS